MKNLHISILKYYDILNGNTYFSGYFIVDKGLESEDINFLEFQYGYGEQYRFQILKELKQLGYIDKEVSSLFPYARENKIEVTKEIRETENESKCRNFGKANGNKNVIRQSVRNHIFHSVTDYNGDYLDTTEEAILHLWERFDKEFNYDDNKKRYPNEFKRFIEYLWGGVSKFEVYTHHQREQIKRFGFDQDTVNYDSNDVANRYYHLIAKEVFKQLK